MVNVKVLSFVGFVSCDWFKVRKVELLWGVSLKECILVI